MADTAPTVTGDSVSFNTPSLTVRGDSVSFNTPSLTVRGGQIVFSTGFTGSLSLSKDFVNKGESLKVSGEVYNLSDKVSGSVTLNSSGFKSNKSFSFSSGSFSENVEVKNEVGKYNVTAFVTSNGEGFNMSKQYRIAVNKLGISSAKPSGANLDPSGGVNLSVNISGKDGRINLTFIDTTGGTSTDIKQIGNADSGIKKAENQFNSVSEDKKYSWKVNVSNGFETIERDYSFTTHSINLTWNYPEAGQAEGFKIYSDASGSWKEIKQVAADKRTVLVFNKGLETGEKASYRVKAYKGSEVSSPVEAEVTPQLP